LDGRTEANPYDAVVFAGGGCRCFWQAGFWSEAAPPLGLAPRVVGATSAGSALACSVFAGVVPQVLADFRRRVAANESNAYPANVLRGEPVFPHEEMYRATILASLDDAAFRRLQQGPDLRVAVARPPAGVGDRPAFLMALFAFLLEQGANGRVHAAWARRFGFETEVISARRCASPRELADLILHASCSPPMTPLYRRGGRAVFDGGLTDHVPVETVAGARSTLVLLTRRYPEEWIPRVEGRRYVQPSETIPVQRWDYTSPDLVQRAYDIGRRDGEAFARDALRRDAA
jgi:predicted acylesterase/phospholipase RssA